MRETVEIDTPKNEGVNFNCYPPINRHFLYNVALSAKSLCCKDAGLCLTLVNYQITNCFNDVQRCQHICILRMHSIKRIVELCLVLLFISKSSQILQQRGEYYLAFVNKF